MKTRFYLVFNDDKAIHVTRFYDSYEEAMDNAEFIEKYFGIHVRLKISEELTVGTCLYVIGGINHA